MSYIGNFIYKLKKCLLFKNNNIKNYETNLNYNWLLYSKNKIINEYKLSYTKL